MTDPNQAMSRDEFIALRASSDAHLNLKQRSEKILMDMDQQIDETVLKLDKMKASREAARMCYTKLFAVPVDLPSSPASPPAPVKPITPPPSPATPAPAKVVKTVTAGEVLLKLFEKSPKKPHSIPAIKRWIAKQRLADSISEPYMYSVLSTLVKQRKIIRVDHGTYAHSNLGGL